MQNALQHDCLGLDNKLEIANSTIVHHNKKKLIHVACLSEMLLWHQKTKQYVFSSSQNALIQGLIKGNKEEKTKFYLLNL